MYSFVVVFFVFFFAREEVGEDFAEGVSRESHGSKRSKRDKHFV